MRAHASCPGPVVITDHPAGGMPEKNEADRGRAHQMAPMKDVRGFTDMELVEELHRLESLDEMTRCDEIRLDIVRDELVRRQSRHAQSPHAYRDTVFTGETSNRRTTQS